MTGPKVPIGWLASRGVVWSAGAELFIQAVRIGTLAGLARLVLPEAFGLIAMAMIVTGIVTMVNELGLVAAIVQRPTLESAHKATAFWVSAGMGVVVALSVALLSPLVGAFYDNAAVAPILAALSSGFAFGGLGLVHRALLQRELRFARLTAIEAASEAAFAATALTLALAGFGVWALVAGMVARPASQSAMLWLASSFRPAPIFSRRAFGELFGFGATVMGSGVVNYARSNLDYTAVGRVFGDSVLGYYSMAYELVTRPVFRLASVVTRVAFPAFSRVQEEPERLRRGYLKVVAYVALVAQPLIIGLMLTAPDLVPVALGSGWGPVVPLLQVLAVAAWFKVLGATIGVVLKATGHAALEFRWNLIMFGATALAILAALPMGAIGVAVAISAVTGATFPVIQTITNRRIALGWPSYVRALVPGLTASGGLAAAVIGVQVAIPEVEPALRLALAVASGTAAYVVSAWFVGRELAVELVAALRGTA